MKPYWRLWTADGLSNLADGVLKTAVPLIAVGLTRDPVAVAGLGVAFTLPWLVCALPAGALVDRVDRRRAMLAANATRGALLLVMFGVHELWALYAVALCVGVTETVYDTAAQSIVPQIVDRDLLPRANGRLYAVELMANEFAGPPLAGLLVGVGAMAAFGAPVALWAAAVAVLATLPGRFKVARPEPTTLRADIAEGLCFLVRQPILRTFTVATALFNLATSATFAILVLYAVGPGSAMSLSEQTYGVLIASTAAGSLLGSLLAERIEHWLGRARALQLSYVVSAVTIAVPTMTTNPVTVGIGLFTGSAAVLVTNIVMVSLRQRITPDRLLGRLNSTHRLVAWGTKPLGAALGGFLATTIGVRPVFAVVAILPLLALIGLVRVSDRRLDSVDRIWATAEGLDFHG
ncbi:MFS transporter [Kutzneria sp. CA-103260]|uniref:MFS transporter n=1 Tax=Kutzneria sp. CA-103260 TaxID=2802641 RepID=UPI001BED564E|nr:MFS transporter [Kutzneria sp. CA-103260]QUQ66737.1 major facilitator superfamily transporter [Kutzneria sp. CA-103260]